MKSEAAKAESRECNRIAVQTLKKKLKAGDRIFAMKAECGCVKHRTFIFDHWQGNWIVSKSGIDTIVPFTVCRINGREFALRRPVIGVPEGYYGYPALQSAGA